MDKSWIHLSDRSSIEYLVGVENFLNFAFRDNDFEKCPCKICKNRFFGSKEKIKSHLLWNGFWKDYTHWNIHGEDLTPQIPINQVSGENVDGTRMNAGGDIYGMVFDAMGACNVDNNTRENYVEDEQHEAHGDIEMEKFIKLVEEAQRPLYEGCELTSLSFLVQLLNIKVTCSITDRAISEMLKLMHKAFPNAALPKSYYEAKKRTVDLGFDFETWDVCPNNCMIYRNEDKDLEYCSICEQPRYKQITDINGNTIVTEKKEKKIPRKQMRYFPLIPRLKRLFMSRHTSSLMKWHASEERSNDGVMRHPADSPAWKALDERYPNFASEPRNIRFGLASDGFNPYGNLNNSYSIWPIVLIPYNLPPWLCMKQENFILSTLIDGPNSPGDKIDVYLQPLIDELGELWVNGVDTFDASSKEEFKLHAALLWTINDFPALANLSGWSTKGKFACPHCNKNTKSFWLKYGGKHCYMGHRRWLDRSHKFRRDKLAFDGEQEWDSKPKLLSGSELLEQLKDVSTMYKKEDVLKMRKKNARGVGRKKKDKAAKEIVTCEQSNQSSTVGKKRRRSEEVNVGTSRVRRTHNWKKKSIFFELPYWENLLIRHCLDVMHTEKNVCDNILHTLLSTSKSKDSIKARLDLKRMRIRKSLHPKEGVSGSKKLPPAIFALNKCEKQRFLKVLKNVKVPDGYASNISRHVDLKKGIIGGLKTHDNHILLQQLLPLAIRRVLPSKVVKVLIEVSNFYRQLCSKVNRKSDLMDIQKRIELALCHLEKLFPPAFFDIMVHLTIHLAEEAMLAGPVQFRWMYPIERYLQTLKKYVRNRARPAGSIAHGYVLEECMNFCGRYLDDFETKSSYRSRNDNGDEIIGCHFGKAKSLKLNRVTLEQAHRYVLANHDDISQYREEHLSLLREKMPRASDHQLHSTHSEQFPNWFREHVNSLVATSSEHNLSDEIIKLAAGPTRRATRFSGYKINGFKFRTKSTDISKVTNHSGVCLEVNLRSYASKKDKNPSSGDVTFYGVLTDIIQLDYTCGTEYVLFKCDWVDINRGKREDEFKMTSVNFNHLLYRDNKLTDEPFILASQARQVIYVQDPVDQEWHVALKMNCRELFDLDSSDNSVVLVPQVQSFCNQQLDTNRMLRDEESIWVREGGEEMIIDYESLAATVASFPSDSEHTDESDDYCEFVDVDEDV